MISKKSVLKPIMLTAVAGASTLMMSSVNAQAVLSCPSGSVGDALLWEQVWLPANDLQTTEQFFVSLSEDVIFGIEINDQSGTGGCTGQIQDMFMDRNFEPLLNAPVYPDDRDGVLRVGVNWPNTNCGLRIRVKAYQNTSGLSNGDDLSGTGTNPPAVLRQLEYTLYDVDIGNPSGGLRTWDDLLLIEPAPESVTAVGAGPNANFTVTDNSPANFTIDAGSENCTESATPGQVPYFTNCFRTIRWGNTTTGLSQFDFTYQAGSQSIADPVFQRINISNVSYCLPIDPEIEVVKTDSPDPVRSGENLVYTLAVTHTNDTITPAEAVTLSDTLPVADVTWVSTQNSNGGGTCTTITVDPVADCNCTEPGDNAGAVVCNVGDLDTGETGTVVVTTKVN